MATALRPRFSKSQKLQDTSDQSNAQSIKQYKLAFIINSPSNKLDPNARRLVRSHVMQGKNRRHRAADLPRLKSWINQESSQQPQLNPSAVPDVYFPLLFQIGSDLPVTQFACEMPPYALDLVFKCEFGLRVSLLY